MWGWLAVGMVLAYLSLGVGYMLRQASVERAREAELADRAVQRFRQMNPSKDRP